MNMRMARRMGSPRYVHNRQRRTREGPELRCCLGFTRGEQKGELTWYRPVGVVSTSSETHRRKDWALRKGKWSPRGTGMSSPVLEVRLGEQARLVKTVNIQRQVGSSPWTRPSAPGCGDTSKASVSFGSIQGADPEQPGSGVAVDWVTGQSCSSAVKAGRRLKVQSGLRKDCTYVFPILVSWSVAVRDSGH